MEPSRVEQMIRDLLAEREAKVAEVTKPYDDIIAGLRTLQTPSGSPQSSPTARRRGPARRGGGHPRGVDAIRQVLMDFPGEMDVRAILTELERRGWMPKSTDPLNATSSSASRAVQQFPGEVVRRRNPSGGYLYSFVRDTQQHTPTGHDSGETMPSSNGTAPATGAAAEDNVGEEVVT